MSPQFSDFRRVKRRMKRTLNYGSKQPNSINKPLCDMVIDYFDKASPFDYMSPQTSANIGCRGFADPCTLVVAMVYLDRIRIKDREFFESSDPVDLYLPALVLASKFLHDSDTIDRATNSDWAEAADISDSHLNNLEWEFVKHLDWHTMVKQEECETWLKTLECWVAADFLKVNGFTTYNELANISSSISLSRYLSILKDLCSVLTLFSFVYGFSLMVLISSPMVLQTPSTSSVEVNSSLLTDGTGWTPLGRMGNVENGPSVAALPDSDECSREEGSMRVCVIGAGASGLPAIKACLEEQLDVVCYEKTSQIGGLWNYRPNQKDIGATVMATTVVNTSKEMMAYSDMPPPEEWANFMHHSKVNEYLNMYADKFNLRQHIQFNTTVNEVSQSEFGWKIELGDGKVEEFDKLMLCTGHHADAQFPQFKGSESFKGEIIHAQVYRDFKGFEDKNVVLIGIGNSALDIAVDIAKIAKSVTISTRRGTWIFNRVAQGGMPYDTLFMTRYYSWIMDTIPWSVANDFMEHRVQQRMDHDIYGLRPNHRFFQQHPTVNDSLANLISSGYITITEDIDRLDEHEVVMTNGKRFSCDILIACTGYTFGFPFMKDQEIINIKDHSVSLYKYVFPPSCADVAVIGLIQPIGSVAPISEMQCRWAARVFTGKSSLPTIGDMMSDMELKKKAMKRRYFNSNKHTIQVDYVKYMDELAALIGCKPDFVKILLSDYKFAVRLFMGPNVPYVYRLQGPHACTEAEQYIRTVPDRVKKPLKNRLCRTRKHKKRGTTDEYFRYISLKWIAAYSIFIFCAGLFWFTVATSTVSAASFTIQFFTFAVLFSFMLLWFDLQYDMTTIL